MQWHRKITARWRIPHPFRAANTYRPLPSAVTDYLLPYERRVVTVRRHPGQFITHVALLTCACTAASLLTAVTSSGPLVLGAAWGTCAAAFLYLIARIAQYLSTYFVVAETRLIFITGILKRKVITVPIRELSDLELRRRWVGRLIGYGSFIARPSTPGYRIPTMNYMPYPEQVFREVVRLISPEEIENPGQRILEE